MKRYELEREVIEAAETCVDSGGIKMMDLIRAVRALRSHRIQMPTDAPVSGKHPVTSKLAAAWMNAEHPDLAAKVFREIWACWVGDSAAGATTDEVQRMMEGSHQSISPRITELRNEGWIQDSGLRRKTRSGRTAVVWTVTQAAIDAMNEGTSNGRLF